MIGSVASVRDWLRRTYRSTASRRPVMEMQPHQSPSNQFLLDYVLVLLLFFLSAIIMFQRLGIGDRQQLLAACGVSLRKVARAVHEIQRKGFHVAGLLVPLTQLILLRNGVSQEDCVRICWTITIVGTTMDYLRLHSTLVARHWPLRSILREHEHKQLTGGCYFALGCTLSIGARPPAQARPRSQRSACRIAAAGGLRRRQRGAPTAGERGLAACARWRGARARAAVHPHPPARALLALAHDHAACTLCTLSQRAHFAAELVPQFRPDAPPTGVLGVRIGVCACLLARTNKTFAAVSPPSVAMASILFLVLGDMSAAIIGVSFGGDALGQLRLGREGKKCARQSARIACAQRLRVASPRGACARHLLALCPPPPPSPPATVPRREGQRVATVRAWRVDPLLRVAGRSLEGSLAMFFVCLAIGCTIFANVRLREYPVFWGALVATLTELAEPLRLNDNLTCAFAPAARPLWAAREGLGRLARRRLTLRARHASLRPSLGGLHGPLSCLVGLSF